MKKHTAPTNVPALTRAMWGVPQCPEPPIPQRCSLFLGLHAPIVATMGSRITRTG